MEETSQTEAEYVAAISNVSSHVQAQLDEPLTPHRLADVACFSQHHFHRVFRAIVGESVMDHIRRLRLQRAAYLLKTSRGSASSIGYDAGYVAQAAFTRVFKAYFGLAPTWFRMASASYLLLAACGVHFAPSGFSPLRRVVSPEFLAADRLCPAHRDWASNFESRWDELIGILTGFASLVYPLRLAAQEKHMNSTTFDVDQEIDKLQNEVEAAKQRLTEARKRRPKELVEDYVLQDSDGPVRLSELFGDKDDLILVHNMGTGCSYCTVWADGFTGIAPHLMDRAAFVLCSPDKPEVQKRFAEKRNWNFRIVSAHGSPFIRDMGFWEDDGPHPGAWPGVSTFRREPGGNIYRIAKSHFGPGDDFCAVWPFLDMLESGANGWEPKYEYEG